MASFSSSNNVTADQRLADRFDVSGHVEVRCDDSLVATGNMIDLSITGISISTTRSLNIGREYTLILDNFGTHKAQIVRCLGEQNYGAKFVHTDVERLKLLNRMNEYFYLKNIHPKPMP